MFLRLKFVIFVIKMWRLLVKALVIAFLQWLASIDGQRTKALSCAFTALGSV